MRNEHPDRWASRWPYLALAGVGLAAIPLAAAARRRRREVDPDSAPGYTARRDFGDYRVVGRSVTIARPRAELFAFWRDFQNLPRFMVNLEKIEPSGEEPGHNTWHIRAPGGRVFAVDTRIAREVDGELIAWRSTEDSEIDTEGRVTFEDAPGERGTRVSLIIAYKPKGGAIGEAIATLAQRSPELQARHDLKRFKMLMETGEIATSARTRSERQHQLEEAR
ncbi:MAG: SRPBCC family protein [Erythrobacter sp.]|uniref:SRPBCC family protein n=1 Tax=Erythrobacter sp. TaxID=1042 RepID=UPI0025F30F90|nr:SRPBCC family protein [Erythrobacter sp.]MCM0000143.1 SRPBCC family protein [Erythrobacter sp.]